jgi:hypothetical protein
VANRSSWYQLSGLVLAFYGDGEERLGPALADFFDTVPIFGPRTELCDLMTLHNSDKGSKWHNYTLLYHFLFRHSRREIRHLFELGLGSNFTDVPSNMGSSGTPGASLRAWRDYFTHAQIVGADIDTRILFSDGRITTYYVDQTSADAIRKLWDSLQDVSFDIIIDDGLHSFEANSLFLQNSFYKLRPAGYYFVEDIELADQNIKRYDNFFSKFGQSGALVRLPSVANNYDNCLALFRAGL